VIMTNDNSKRRLGKLGTLAVGALALGAVTLPAVAQAQVYFDVGPYGVGVGVPGPYYYPHYHHYWGPGYYYGPYRYGW
jgi:hypothetical protein